jgi:hypothetical protein
MNGLKEYQRRRLDLADVIRAALHIARAYGDDEREQEARQLLERLSADRFRLAVAGQFSRGKSTLMNALLGAAYLPMGALPMTSVVTTVRYGSRTRAMVRRRGSAPARSPVSRRKRRPAPARPRCASAMSPWCSMPAPLPGAARQWSARSPVHSGAPRKT